MAQAAPLQFAYRRHADQDRRAHDAAHHPVVIVGAGPVGLTLAIDLALRGQRVVLLDESDRIGDGSRAICFSKRSLEVWDRLGVAAPMLDKGVVWQVGKIFRGDALLTQFDLLPEAGHKMPAFINLQQFYAEAFLVARALQLPQIDLRWRNTVRGLTRHNDHAELTVETPDGPHTLRASYVVACDGARSALRAMVGADFVGESFADQFLIADVKMTAAFPTERWFWFDPPFHAGRSALLHKQPDDVWRIDLQLAPDADPAVERQPERVRPRIARMLGHDDFAFEWISLYRFHCRRMKRFLHGRVIFAGDAAHQVSPFGARGANSGIEDAENLGWKLAMVLSGDAPTGLLDSYDSERGAAADDNIRASTWATDFMVPHSPQEERMRHVILSLAGEADFARRMINGGRLSVPSIYQSPLSTGDEDAWDAGPRPGTSLIDAPLRDTQNRPVFLSEAFAQAGRGFTLVESTDGNLSSQQLDGVARLRIGEHAPLRDAEGLFARRYGAAPGTAYLVRPDGYVAARMKNVRRNALAAVLARAQGRAA
jgi:3-(3-hydroxy-phenyl)propionate hydroxylase